MSEQEPESNIWMPPEADIATRAASIICDYLSVPGKIVVVAAAVERTADVIRRLTPALMAGAWISVKERLPARHLLVLVTAHGYGYIAAVDKDGNWIDTCGELLADSVAPTTRGFAGVTHWMPVPQPPAVDQPPDDPQDHALDGPPIVPRVK